MLSPIVFGCIRPPHLSMWEMQPTHNVDSVEWYQGPGQNWDDSVGILQRMSATKPHLTCIIYLQPSIVQHMILTEDTGFDGMTLALILYV